jgi:hypothetical protein
MWILTEETTDLLREIAHCPNVSAVFRGARGNPCSEVIRCQGVSSLSMFQVPEPWNGRIHQASLLYLSSNPSISEDEQYPTWDSPDEHIGDFFQHRFGGGRKDWVREGKYGLAKDGTYLPATAYWAEILNRSRELFGREVVPGIDFALTEIVHCNSRNMIGVEAAITECAARYLPRVFQVSSASVVALIGKKVGDLFRKSFKVDDSLPIVGPRNVAGRDRLFLFFAAPGSNKPRTIDRVFSQDQIQLIRRYLF